MNPEVFHDLSDKLSLSLINEDCSLYKSVMHVPVRLERTSSDVSTLKTDAELEEHFTHHSKAIRSQGITAISRDVTTNEQISRDMAWFTCDVKMMSTDREVKAAFEATFHIRSQDNRWGLYFIHSSPTHLNWVSGLTAERPMERAN